MTGREFPQYVQDVSESSDVRLGFPLLQGATQRGAGVSFALCGRHATQVRLELYDRPEDSVPVRIIALDPAHHRTRNVWDVWVEWIWPGQIYGYRVESPYELEKGHRFHPSKLPVNPLATALTRLDGWDFGSARGYDPSSSRVDLSYSELDDAGAMPTSNFTQEHFDWEGDQPLLHATSETVIYEVKVR